MLTLYTSTALIAFVTALITPVLSLECSKNVSGGVFIAHRYQDSYVIRAESGVGPKMCIKDCLLQDTCNAVNYGENRMCELLIVTDHDTKTNNAIFYYSEIAGWDMESNQCWPNPCTNGDRCIIAKFGHWICVPVEDGCANNPCNYGGTCRNTVGGVRCICATGYSGENCEVTPCFSSPCKNNGSCSPNGPGFICSCPTGYSGLMCEVTPCSSSPCLNSGSCSLNGPSYKCTCPTGYSGERCEVTPCSTNPCVYGTCTINVSTYTCTCPTSFSGNKCEKTPCDNSICKNGATCKMHDVNYVCTCPVNYQGTHCETYVAPAAGK